MLICCRMWSIKRARTILSTANGKSATKECYFLICCMRKVSGMVSYADSATSRGEGSSSAHTYLGFGLSLRMRTVFSSREAARDFDISVLLAESHLALMHLHSRLVVRSRVWRVDARGRWSNTLPSTTDILATWTSSRIPTVRITAHDSLLF
jgi:hypothetical protein